MADFFRKYKFVIILIVPLFMAGTTIQHSLDMQNFLPTDQTTTSTPLNPFSDVLEEISSEDDIHSIHVILSYPVTFWTDSDYLYKEVNTLDQIVPTPPPDFV